MSLKDHQFRLHINLGNEAMQTPQDVGRALRMLGYELQYNPTSNIIRDINGNKVGEWTANWPEETTKTVRE